MAEQKTVTLSRRSLHDRLRFVAALLADERITELTAKLMLGISVSEAGEVPMADHKFDPDWTIAPAETLQEWLGENHLSVRVLAVACGGRARMAETVALIEDVLARRPLTAEHARVLAIGTGIAARFWQNFEHNYRAGLAAGLTDASDG